MHSTQYLWEDRALLQDQYSQGYPRGPESSTSELRRLFESIVGSKLGTNQTGK